MIDKYCTTWPVRPVQSARHLEHTTPHLWAPAANGPANFGPGSVADEVSRWDFETLEAFMSGGLPLGTLRQWECNGGHGTVWPVAGGLPPLTMLENSLPASVHLCNSFIKTFLPRLENRLAFCLTPVSAWLW